MRLQKACCPYGCLLAWITKDLLPWSIGYGASKLQHHKSKCASNFCKKLKWHFSSCATYFLDSYPAFLSGVEGSLNPSTALVSQITQSPRLLANQPQQSAHNEPLPLNKHPGSFRPLAAIGHLGTASSPAFATIWQGQACASCRSSWGRPSCLVPLLFGK